jgi:hypothetical protein
MILSSFSSLKSSEVENGPTFQRCSKKISQLEDLRNKLDKGLLIFLCRWHNHLNPDIVKKAWSSD